MKKRRKRRLADLKPGAFVRVADRLTGVPMDHYWVVLFERGPSGFLRYEKLDNPRTALLVTPTVRLIDSADTGIFSLVVLQGILCYVLPDYLRPA